MVLDDRPPVQEDSTIPYNKGTAVVAATVDVMAAMDDDTDALKTFVVLSEKASNFHFFLKLVYCVWHVLDGHFSCTTWALVCTGRMFLMILYHLLGMLDT